MSIRPHHGMLDDNTLRGLIRRRHSTLDDYDCDDDVGLGSRSQGGYASLELGMMSGITHQELDGDAKSRLSDTWTVSAVSRLAVFGH